MRLHDLKPPAGAKTAAKRKGRGPASGLGRRGKQKISAWRQLRQVWR